MAWWEADVRKRDILGEIKSKYPLTDAEKEAVDYAILLIQNEIDGEVE